MHMWYDKNSLHFGTFLLRAWDGEGRKRKKKEEKSRKE